MDIADLRDYPCQEDTITEVVGDVSAADLDAQFGGSTTYNTEDLSVDLGPGGVLPKAFDGSVLIPDGGSSYLELPNPIMIASDQQRSLLFWVYMKTSGGLVWYLAHDDSLAENSVIWWDSVYALNIQTSGEDVLTVTDPTMSGDSWHLFGLNFQGDGTVDLIRNGVPIDTFTGVMFSDFGIKRLLVGEVQTFDGLFCGLKLYSTLKNAAYQLALYNEVTGNGGGATSAVSPISLGFSIGL